MNLQRTILIGALSLAAFPALTYGTNFVLDANNRTISAPGTYTGNFTTTDSASTVTVTCTGTAPVIIQGATLSATYQTTTAAAAVIKVTGTAPVIIKDCSVSGNGTLVYADDNSNVTVRNTYGFGLDPKVAGVVHGYFFYGSHTKNAVIEHCYIKSTRGILFQQYNGDRTLNNTYIVRFNRFVDIDGRYSESVDNSTTPPTVTYRSGTFDANNPNGHDNVGTDVNKCSAVAIWTMAGVPGIDISYNEVINTPYCARPEDNFTVLQASGTAASPIHFHDNFLWGSFNNDPENSAGFFGSGFTADGRQPATLAIATGYMMVEDNQVAGCIGACYQIAAGHNVTMQNNVSVTSSYLPNGNSSNGIRFRHCEVSMPRALTLSSDRDDVHDGLSGQKADGTMSLGSVYDDKLLNNQVVMQWFSGGSPLQSSIGSGGGGYCVNHTSDPHPPHSTDSNWRTTAGCQFGTDNVQYPFPGTEVTFEDEKALYKDWWSKLTSQGLQVGVINGEVIYEGERLPVAAANPAGTPSVGNFDDRAHEKYWASYAAASPSIGDYVSYYVHIPMARKYHVAVGIKTNSSRGDFQLSTADTVGGTYTARGSAQNCRTGQVFEERSIADISFSSNGTKVFKFAVVNTAGSIGIDYIKLTPLDSVFEAEYLDATPSVGDTNYLDTPDANFSNGLAMHFVGNSSGDSVVYTLPGVAANATNGYKVFVGYKTQTNRGKFKLDAAKIDPLTGIGSYGIVGPAGSDGTPVAHDMSLATSTYPELEVTNSTSLWKPGSTSDKAFRFTLSPGSYAGGLHMLLDYFRLDPQ